MNIPKISDVSDQPLKFLSLSLIKCAINIHNPTKLIFVFFIKKRQ